MSTPPEQPGDANAPEPTKPPAPAASAELEIDALLNEAPAEEPTRAEEHEPPTEAEIDALLNAPPAEAASTEPEPDPEQDELLAALNTSLKELPEQPQAEEPAQSLSIEDQLQQEIEALMSAEPEISKDHAARASAKASANVVIDDDDEDVLAGRFASPEELAGIEAAQAPAGPSTEDQIAMEIEGLLATDQAPAATATAEPRETAIDELDQMLAQEIDEDDELAGDFHSVEDLTAGIQIDENTPSAEDDEHAATARDVAAELDSQPEDLPAPPSADASEDIFKELDKVVGQKSTDKAQPRRLAALQASDMKGWLETAKEMLLVACYWINWPARRFLSTEWRANLGYIALLNLFFGVGLWVVRILF